MGSNASVLSTTPQRPTKVIKEKWRTIVGKNSRLKSLDGYLEGVSRKGKKRSDDIHREVEVALINDKVYVARLRLYGHVEQWEQRTTAVNELWRQKCADNEAEKRCGTERYLTAQTHS